MGEPPWFNRPNYQRWDLVQTRLLKDSFAAGKDLHEMTKIINDHIKETRPGAVKTFRTTDSIAYKLRHLKLISDEEMKSMLKVKRVFIRFNRLNNYDEIRNSVFSRDNKKCTICGKEENLQLAHIIPFRETFQKNLPELITLCRECHKLLDKYNEFETEKVFNYMCNIYPDYKENYMIFKRYNPVTNSYLCEIKKKR